MIVTFQLISTSQNIRDFLIKNTSADSMQACRLFIVTIFFLWQLHPSTPCVQQPLAVTNCAAIDSANTLGRASNDYCGCLTCSTGYYPYTPTACANCSTLYSSYCQTCNASTCLTCSIWYSPDTTGLCRGCENIISSCNTCNFFSSPPKCLSCGYGYLLSPSPQLCADCAYHIPNCKYCINATACSTCRKGYGLTNISRCGTCVDLIPNCVKCYSPANCSECAPGYNLYNSNSVCAICSQLIANCFACMNTTSCISCKNTTLGVNYTSAPDTCVECQGYDPICLECTLYTYCTKCSNNLFTLSYNSSLLQTCVACEQILEGCYNCSSNTSCLSCIDNSTYLYNPTHFSCQQCNYFLPQCATCLPSYFCLTCFTKNYAVSPNGTCQLCDTYIRSCGICNSTSICTYCYGGGLVPDYTGCTRVIGCVSVDPLNPISDNCIACNTIEFEMIPQFGRCVCTLGWLVGAHCTTVVGCTATNLVANVSICLSCNTVKRFILTGVTCICAQYYSRNGTTCSETCGDGYVINAECDDGNTLSGDGCSTQCRIEKSYQCSNDNSRNPVTRCQFRAKVELTLVSILKIPTPSTAQITYDITPYSNAFKKMNLLPSITLNADGCFAQNAQIVDGQLVVTFVYNKNIHNQDAEIILDFDDQFVISPDARLRFKMVESRGITLDNEPEFFYDSSTPIFLILSLSTLSVFAIGSLSFKMIGVETIYPIQISWLLMNTSKYFKTYFFIFSELNNSYGQFHIATTAGTTLKNNFAGLGFTSNINDNYMLYAATNGFIVFVYGSALLYKFYISQEVGGSQDKNMNKVNMKHKKTLQAIAKLQKVDNFLRKLYNWILFPFFIGFFLHLLHTLYASQYQNVFTGQTPFYYIFPILMALITTSFIFHSQIFTYRGKPRQPTILKKYQQNRYVAYFLGHNFTVFLMLSFRMAIDSQLLTLLAVGTILTHTIYLIIKRPYQGIIHNMGIIFNQLAILFSFGWILTKGTFIDTVRTSTLFFYAFLCLFYSINFFGLIRSILAIKQACSKLLKDDTKPTKKKKPITMRDIDQVNNEFISFPKKGRTIEEAMIDAKPNFSKLSVQSPFLKDGKNLGRNRNRQNKLQSIKDFIYKK